MNDFVVKKGNTFPLGVSLSSDGAQFSMVNRTEEESGIILILKSNPKVQKKIAFPKCARRGNISSMIVEKFSFDDYAYKFYEGDAQFIDPYSSKIVGSASKM